MSWGHLCLLHRVLLSNPWNTNSKIDYDNYLFKKYSFTEVPTTLPSRGDPPVTENDSEGVLTVSGQAVYWMPQKFLSILIHIV